MPEIRRVDYGPEFHRLLLRVAGYAPDDTIAEARRALAQGRVADVAKAVGAISAAAGLAPTDEDFALLAAVAPESVDALSDTQPGEWPLRHSSSSPRDGRAVLHGGCDSLWTDRDNRV